MQLGLLNTLVFLKTFHYVVMFLPGQEVCGPGHQCNGSSRLPGAGGRGVTGSIHCSALCFARHISGTHALMLWICVLTI